MKVIKYIVFLILLNCSAKPNEVDIEKTIKTFLELRFRSSYDKNLSQLKEYELFQISCRQNRVKCDEVLHVLKKTKPEFYNTLIQSK